jgi:hypothetical protein
MMTTKSTVLSFGAAASVAIASAIAYSADLRPSVVTNITGTLRIQQGIPCDDDVDQTTPATGGRMELSPSEGIAVGGGGRAFTLTRMNVSFAPFSVHRSCGPYSETRSYGDSYVQITHAVSFTAAPTATPNVFAVTIPKDSFDMYYTTTMNGTPEIGYKRPKEDVTGTINLGNGAVTMRVALGTSIHFTAGCTFLGCVIDTTKDGTLSADLAGTLVFPDSDGDGVPDRSDNCKLTANPDQSPVTTPRITPPPNVTLASCLDRNFGYASAADICDATPVGVTSNAPAVFTVGANTVTWTARDGFQRTTTANQTVTIVDKTPPLFTFVPPDVHLNDCGAAALGTPAATDDCAGTPTFSNNAPPKFYVGTTPVTWTATDASGNQSTANQNVVVVDTVPPTVYCVATNPTGSSFRVSAYDSCTAAPVIKLGSYVLADGEVIQINETGQSGIRLQGIVGVERIRHFQVGRGEAILTATDESGNVGTIACSVPR